MIELPTTISNVPPLVLITIEAGVNVGVPQVKPGIDARASSVTVQVLPVGMPLNVSEGLNVLGAAHLALGNEVAAAEALAAAKAQRAVRIDEEVKKLRLGIVGNTKERYQVQDRVFLDLVALLHADFLHRARAGRKHGVFHLQGFDDDDLVIRLDLRSRFDQYRPDRPGQGCPHLFCHLALLSVDPGDRDQTGLSQAGRNPGLSSIKSVP